MQHRNDHPGAVVGHITNAVRTGGISREVVDGFISDEVAPGGLIGSGVED
jgi:hypothetical protein